MSDFTRFGVGGGVLFCFVFAEVLQPKVIYCLWKLFVISDMK